MSSFLGVIILGELRATEWSTEYSPLMFGAEPALWSTAAKNQGFITVFWRDGNGGNGGTGWDGKTAIKMGPPSRPVPPPNSLTVVTYRSVPPINISRWKQPSRLVVAP